LLSSPDVNKVRSLTSSSGSSKPVLDLQGKRVLVVGASAGIGRAIAAAAADRGARVVASARRGERLKELDAAAVVADVRREADCRRLVDEAVATLGGLDGLVYGVGMSMLRPIADATMDDWRHVFESNVFGAALVTARAAPHLLESGGRAVILSSKAVRDPFPDLALYTTSKIALDGLIRCLPKEFPGLLVTRLVIGNTADTEFSNSWDPAALDAAIDRWAASGVLGANGAMSTAQVASAALFALLGPVYIDDMAVIERDNDDGSRALQESGL
jgi:NAD(P)-dependent dehydrogenase (short-subunit alcohol dehydrogenase family)